MYADMDHFPAKVCELYPAENFDSLSVVFLACQDDYWFSVDILGVHGTCSMLEVFIDLVDLFCLQNRLSAFPLSGVKTLQWDTYSIRQHIELQTSIRVSLPFFGRTKKSYQRLFNGTAYQQGTVGPIHMMDV